MIERETRIEWLLEMQRSWGLTFDEMIELYNLLKDQPE